MLKHSLALMLLLLPGCPPGEPAVAPAPTADDTLRKLPAPLRERFDSAAGRREIEAALADRALLVAEAHRRGLDRTPDVTQQVRALEERLAVQALLAEEKKTLRASDDELRAFYEAKKAELAQPERVQVRRLFVAARGDEEAAKKKAAALLLRLNKGERFEVLLRESDGAERVRGGDFGAVDARHEDRALATAAFALVPGQTSPVVATQGGFSILVCDRRLPARTPPFEEVRADLENRYQPTLERRAFERLLSRLRAQGEAK